jgi:uncharacterized damage-inducible protein DinB
LSPLERAGRLRELDRLFAYDGWANGEALAALRRAGAPPPRALAWMAHVVAVEWLWLGRLRREKRAVVAWPDLALDRCAEELAALAAAWRAYLGELTPERLAEPIAYVNSQGEPWTSTADDVLTQVVTHSVYHRGQIAAELRAAGHTPPCTDFIHAVRQGFVE